MQHVCTKAQLNEETLTANACHTCRCYPALRRAECRETRLLRSLHELRRNAKRTTDRLSSSKNITSCVLATSVKIEVDVIKIVFVRLLFLNKKSIPSLLAQYVLECNPFSLSSVMTFRYLMRSLPQ